MARISANTAGSALPPEIISPTRLPAKTSGFSSTAASGTAPAEVREAVVPMRDAYEARWTALLTDLALDTPVGLTRLTLFGAMNTSVEWFDPDRGNLDELADVITRQFWEGVAA